MTGSVGFYGLESTVFLSHARLPPTAEAAQPLGAASWLMRVVRDTAQVFFSTAYVSKVYLANQSCLTSRA